jgi:hypothetical protein
MRLHASRVRTECQSALPPETDQEFAELVLPVDGQPPCRVAGAVKATSIHRGQPPIATVQIIQAYSSEEQGFRAWVGGSCNQGRTVRPRIIVRVHLGPPCWPTAEDSAAFHPPQGLVPGITCSENLERPQYTHIGPSVLDISGYTRVEGNERRNRTQRRSSERNAGLGGAASRTYTAMFKSSDRDQT